MKGLFVKKFATVVMDGSDENVVSTITESINIVTKERYGESTCRSFDSEHPTMKVIETYTKPKTYKKIQNMIENSYPGLCVFSAIM